MNPDRIDEKQNVLITPEMIVEAIYSAIESRSPRWRELETQALKLAAVQPEVMEACVAYAREIIGGRWEELEPVILRAFASNPVAGRECVDDWYEVDAIGDHIWAYLDLIDGRWLEWEQEMVGLAAMNIDLLHNCVRYAKERIKDRWLDVEPLLLRAILSANESYVWTDEEPLGLEWTLVFDYAAKVVRGPWQELEAAILDHDCLPTHGVHYAIYGRKGRWPGLEEKMLGPPYGSWLCEQTNDIVWYAAQLFEGRPWPEAERFFKEDLRKRSPEASANAAYSYATRVIEGRWESGEELLSGFPSEMYCYARYTLKRPLPDHLHQEMVMRSFETLDAWYIEDYFKWCDEWEAAARGESP